jgi:hypothetical protein
MYLNFGSDVKAISGLSASMRETHKKGMDDSCSFIPAKSFPMNIEVIQDLLIMRLSRLFLKTETISIQMNQSMILPPEK